MRDWFPLVLILVLVGSGMALMWLLARRQLGWPWWPWQRR
jgi:hypothetical protein